jgi:peptidyl-prolyl cis-trans isomerase SurA
LFLSGLKDMQPENVSEILRGPNGFHILKLHDRRGGNKTASVNQTHVRHILLRPSEIQSIKDANSKLLLMRNRVLSGGDFTALARAHSEDTASASNGGDLGWVSPKQLVPEFERAMNQLGPGELSEPVQTSFGLHLIQVLERRDQDVTEERERISARKQIHARKADEFYEQWVRQLRDEAFVEYLGEEVN